MGKAKAPKLFGCAACPWGSKKEQNFVAPEIPENPNLIVVGESPDSFRGEAGEIMRPLWERLDIRPIIVNSANCHSKGKPDTDVLKACRGAYVRPILSQYPDLPIVTYGAFASHSILGGNKKLTTLLYDASMIDRHLTLHTYHPKAYLLSGDEEIWQHLEITTKCAVTPSLIYPSETDWHFPMLREIFSSPEIVLDVETEDPVPVVVPGEKKKKQPKFIYPWVGGKLCWVGLRANGKNYTWNVPAGTLVFELGRLFKEYTGTIIGHNIKGDMVFLAYYGIRAPKARLWDCYAWLKSQYVWSNSGNSLKWQAKNHLEAPAYEAVVHTKWDDKIPTSQIPFEEMRNYLAGDLVYSDGLYQAQKDQKKTVAFQLATDYLPIVTDMEINGFAVDVEVVLQEIQKNVQEQERLREEVRSLASLGGVENFNPQSTDQIIAFCARFGLRLDSTDEEALELNKHRHPILEKIVALRKVAKLKSTYWDTYLKWATHHAGDGRVHAQHGVQGTESGRLNCKNPNMQNPPEKVRHCFISRYPGGRLLDPDLSALEYRLIAHVSQDETLCGMFRRKGYSTTKDKDDIHVAAAMMVYELAVAEAIDRRGEGKTINYMGVYGGGYEKFLETSGLPDSLESRTIFNKIKSLYSGVEKWKQDAIRRLHLTGRVVNVFGRVRQFDGEITPEIEREAINWVIQSAGHDILIIFVLELVRRFAGAGLLSILMVAELHDEPVFDVSAEEYAQGAKIVEEVGLGLNQLILDCFGVDISVPIFAECKVLEVWK